MGHFVGLDFPVAVLQLLGYLCLGGGEFLDPGSLSICPFLGSCGVHLP
jgi:hypothetical protein